MSDDKKGAAGASAASAASKDGPTKDKKSDVPAVDESLERSHYEMELTVVHPLVLLSVVDHYTRVAKDTAKVDRRRDRGAGGEEGRGVPPVCSTVWC